MANDQSLPAIGDINSPWSGATFSGTANFRGWFLDGSGVAKIDVLVDGVVVGQAQYSQSRPDVLAAYPQYQNDNAGFQYSLDTTKLVNGIHSFSVRETAITGSTKELSSIKFNVQNLPAIGDINSPWNGATFSGTATVRGWFLDSSSITKIDVLVDGNVVGQAQYNIPRSDVLAAFPQYQNANAGYQYDLDTTKLSNGTHSFSVQATDTTGATKQLQTVPFNVQNGQSLPAIGDINSPWNGATFSGTANFRGWFLDGNGVSKIDVLVDGNTVGQAQYNQSRSDVLNAYPQYQNANAGFKYDLDTTKLSNGTHSFSIRETATNGATKDLQTIKFSVQNVQNFPAIGDINSPWKGAAFSGTTNVRGWFLDGNGVSKIDVLVDGHIVGQAQYNQPRSDVLNAYPQYQNANAGFQYDLDTTALSNGTHSLSVRETSIDGSTKDLSSVNFSVQNIVNMPGIGDINSPSSSEIISGITNVRGWLLNGKGVSKIDILVDGNIIGQAQYNILRPDVLQVFPQYQNANSGYQFQFDSTQLTNGSHSLTVRATALDGSTTDLKRDFNVQNLINMPTIGDLNSPWTGPAFSGLTTVRGWLLDGSGVDRIDILVDGNVVGQAQYALPRTDVYAIYPLYQNSNAGFEFALDTTKFADGQHIITIKETGKNGNVTTLPDRAVIFNQSPKIGIIADLSKYQGTINFSQLKGQVDGVILRVQAGSTYLDPKYAEYVAGCKANGIPFGTYDYFMGTSVDNAIQEADNAYARMDKTSAFFVADIEEVDSPDVVAAGQAFINELKRLGVQHIGLYSYQNFYVTYNLAAINADWLWIARYGVDDGLPHDPPTIAGVDLWQFTSKGQLPGIIGPVDESKVIDQTGFYFF